MHRSSSIPLLVLLAAISPACGDDGAGSTSDGSGGAPATSSGSEAVATGAGGTAEPPCEGAICNKGRSLALGRAHSCVVLHDGTARCWGADLLSRHRSEAGLPPYVPIEVPGLERVVHLSGNGGNTCAVREDGSVACWGSENLLGAPEVTSDMPVDVEGVTATTLSVGSSHTCAIVADGGVVCWGYLVATDADGDFDSSFSPIPLPGASDAVTIEAGSAGTCLVTRDGSVHCRGANGSGVLGTGDLENLPTLTRIEGIPPAKAVSFGFHFGCALLEDGAIACWGVNTSGQFGNGVTSGELVHPPTMVEGIASAIDVATARQSACAVTDDGAVWCWGGSFWGALGLGDQRESLLPARVPGLSDVIDIDAGEEHVCALTAAGAVFCWGENIIGQVAPQDLDPRYEPVEVVWP